ncbi:MAG: hypothetical protein AAF203_07485 [Pseudomonadota bacterium]
MDNLDADMNEREIAAYVQQQMVDLTPHLEEKTALQMRLTKRKEGFEAELTATSEEGEIQTIGWDKDICDAIKNAKEGLLEYFVEVEAEQNPRERDEKINHLSRNGNLYLH